VSDDQNLNLAKQIASAAADLYHAILESTSTGIVTVDEDDLIVYVNQEACRMWGYEPGELIGNPISLLLPTVSDPHSVHGRPPRRLRSIIGSEVDVEGKSREGKQVRVALSVRETTVGRSTLYTAALQDISDRLRYQDALIDAREQAEEMTRIRTALLTNVGHEIRTPLTGIRGFAGILIEESEGTQREFAQLIEKNSRRLLDTLNSVLELARLEAPVPTTSPTRIDLVQTIRDVAEIIAPTVPANSVEFTVESTHAGIIVDADPESVYSVLYNLIGNAVKFTSKGHVRASLFASPEQVLLIVEDTGVGIASDFLPRLFDEFSQESTGLTRDFEGSGLGLAITRRAVEILDGDIGVQSTKGEGTRFTVTLPMMAEVRGEPIFERVV
jgi:PAS domain S-box-containing protein